MNESDSKQPDFPSIPRQVKNLAGALADFVADGCAMVGEEQYRRRLAICEACEHRRGQRCTQCGCRLRWKARGRAFHCPMDRWPEPARECEASS